MINIFLRGMHLINVGTKRLMHSFINEKVTIGQGKGVRR